MPRRGNSFHKRGKMKKLIWVFVSVIFAIFPMYAYSAVVGDDVVKSWTGLASSYMVRDFCKINNPGNAVIGLEKSICTGGMVSSPNCQIGAGSAMMMLIARDINTRGAEFCTTIAYMEYDGRLHYLRFAYPGNGQQCFWMCTNGSIGSRCNPSVFSHRGKGGVCDVRPISRDVFDDVTMQKGSALGDFDRLSLSLTKTCSGDESYIAKLGRSHYEHYNVLGVVDWTAGGHGAWVQPMTISANSYGVSAWKSTTSSVVTLVCAVGYRPNEGKTDCVPIDEATCASAMLCSDWTGPTYNADTMQMEWDDGCINVLGTEGGYRFKCKDSSMAFQSASDGTCVECVTSGRNGVSPLNGTCVECAQGMIFDQDAKMNGFCATAVAYSRTDLQYGLGKTKNSNPDVSKQCWTMLTASEYLECIKNGGLNETGTSGRASGQNGTGLILYPELDMDTMTRVDPGSAVVLE